jgi:exopolyphosphatase/guanosine-5'-triphosphate,3'-diphosphate pyrophosphatase
MALFDETRAIHGLSDREREWLEYAALLHDIGALISYEQHHKHSYYLIKNGDLARLRTGRDRDDRADRTLPSPGDTETRHDSFGDLKRRKRRKVRALAAMLRLAESLDRATRSRSPASRCTIAATTTCCSSGRQATRSWSSGRRRDRRSRSSA